MQIQDWNQRWQNNQIGFHEAQANPYLTEFLPQFKLPPKATVFVPLCGKSQDLLWLAQNNYSVIGIECSPLAVEDFFNQNALPYSTKIIPDFTVYSSNNITIYQGDFFLLNQSHLSHCDLIYDRASIVAFPEQQRADYVKHLHTWFGGDTQMLLITLCYDQSIMSGPPFSVADDEIKQFYPYKSITQLTQKNVVDEGPRWRQVGLNSLVETAFKII